MDSLSDYRAQHAERYRQRLQQEALDEEARIHDCLQLSIEELFSARTYKDVVENVQNLFATINNCSCSTENATLLQTWLDILQLPEMQRLIRSCPRSEREDVDSFLQILSDKQKSSFNSNSI